MKQKNLPKYEVLFDEKFKKANINSLSLIPSNFLDFQLLPLALINMLKKKSIQFKKEELLTLFVFKSVDLMAEFPNFMTYRWNAEPKQSTEE